MEQATQAKGLLLDTSKLALVEVNDDACECLVFPQTQRRAFLISERW